MRFENMGSNMTTKTKPLRLTLTLILVLAAALGTSCGVEKVDDGASTRAKDYDPLTEGSSDQVLPGDRDVFIDVDESVPAESPCAKTEWDLFHFGDGQEALHPSDRNPALNGILVNRCAACHNIGPASSGATPFSFVLDPQQLVMTIWHRQQGDARFVVPGNPDESQIFLRAAMKQDMPPMYDAAAGAKPLERLTFSEQSVLREWITSCLGTDPLNGVGTSSAGGAEAAGTNAGGAAGAGGTN
jgi:hypothetical protein